MLVCRSKKRTDWVKPKECKNGFRSHLAAWLAYGIRQRDFVYFPTITQLHLKDNND